MSAAIGWTDRECRGLAESAVALLYARDPAIATRYPPGAPDKCVEDTTFHVCYLRAAAAGRSPRLFADYVAWAKALFAGRGLPVEDLRLSLGCLAEVAEREGGAPGPAAAAILREVLAGFDAMAAPAPSPLTEATPLGRAAADYLGALLAMDRRRAEALVTDLQTAGVPVRSLYLDLFQPVMHEVGRLWHANRVSVAQEHYISAATQMIMSRLYPLIFAGEKTGPVVVATCAAGELHEIGMRMVADLLEMDGCRTHYVGANAPGPAVEDMVRQAGADVVAVSATIGVNVPAVADLIRRLRAMPDGEGLCVLVGGAPFNLDPDLWRRVGADATARDAAEATTVIAKLLQVPS